MLKTSHILCFAALGLICLDSLTGVYSKDLNCTQDPGICKKACNEWNKLPYSSTFCDAETGNCVCDCRNRLSPKCTFTPFTPCYSYCVNRNPNPEYYLYVGGKCPIVNNTVVDEQCACKCTLRMTLDYLETNNID